jgi:hypothetical protein
VIETLSTHLLSRVRAAGLVGWNRNPNRNVTEDETNENPRKKTFSRDTTKEGG